MTLADELKKDIFEDEYFLTLFRKLERVYAHDRFGVLSSDTITENDSSDLMRFADILSHSTEPEARNVSYKIISLLVSRFGHTESFKLYAEAVLAKLGNFPALKYLEESMQVHDTLPIEREIDKNIKQDVQQTSNGRNTFTDAQYKIRQRLEKYDFFSFSGPTSIGKTFILTDYIRYLLKHGDSNSGAIVILVPTRALISQVAHDLRNEVDKSDINVATHPILTNYVLKRYKRNIFVFTPERLLSYVAKNTLRVQYLFVDEAQKIVAPNDSRSSLYYHAIYETIRRFATKIYFASPNIPNPDIFLKLFEKDQTGSLAIHEQTVAQNRFFLDLENKKLSFFSDFGDEEVVQGYEFGSNHNQILKEIGGVDNNLVYCNGVSETVRRAKAFAQVLEPVKVTSELRELLGFIAEYVHKEYYLIECLKKGVAFHHGKMPQQVRARVEEFFGDKGSSLRYVFCTSTLLEGVNMPAKNIFVLSDKHGRSDFENIDFENLIGRAGRLTKEFSGNVICVKDDVRRWNKGTDLIKKKQLADVDSFLVTKNNRKSKEFKGIANALNEKALPSSLKAGEKENIIHYASIVLLHHIENDGSVLKAKFLEKTEEASDMLSKAEKINKVPSDILRMSSTIKPRYQNQALSYISKRQSNSILKIDLENKQLFLDTLTLLYDLYNWENEESGGNDPLIPPGLVRKGLGKTRLKYWAMLLRHWIKSEPLYRLIIFSIKYYHDRGEIWFREDGQLCKERFVGNTKQINIIIEQTMSDIENGLRYKIEKYFLNYHLLSKSVLGEENAGEDWSELIEYGTTNKKVIELQNLGLSRGAATHLLSKHAKLLVFDENGTLSDVLKDDLLSDLDNKNEYSQEIINVL